MAMNIENEQASAMEALLALEPTLRPFGALEVLDLRDCALAYMPLALPVCTQLRTLDVGGNRALRSLDGVDALAHLRVLFATGCGLGPALPAGGPLSRCAQLRMLSVKDNGIRGALDGDALPEGLTWLIAAQNSIDEVRAPHRLRHVRKLMLSHNRLTAAALEPLLAAAPALEMLRVACNDLHELPTAALGAHPTLAWLALGGNPYSQRQLDGAAHAQTTAAAPLLGSSDDPGLRISDTVLGRGSGATVKRGSLRGEAVAVKLWTAELFSDGDARGEWAIGRLVGSCPHVVRTLAVFERPQLGMVLELLEGARAAARPPSFASVTRDVLDPDQPALLPAEALHVATEVGRACAWLHGRGLMHGDVYLHNTLLVREGAGAAERAEGARGLFAVRLSDFGASTAYDRAADGHMLERLEVRAYGALLEDLVASARSAPARMDAAADSTLAGLERLASSCRGSAPQTFESIVTEIVEIAVGGGAQCTFRPVIGAHTATI